VRKHLWFFVILLVLAIPLAGCSMAYGAQEKTPTPEADKPLDASAWPTPQPTEAQASPTPFPKVTLAPTPTRKPAPSPTAPEVSAQSTPEQLSFTGNPQEIIERVTELSGGFAPAAAAVVSGGTATIYQRPTESSPPVGTARQGEMAAVLGKNAAGDWLYILTQSTVQGWLPAKALQITFSLGEMPVLPDDPRTSGPPETGLSELLTRVAPVAAAVMIADGILAREGPGTSYPAVGPVEKGELLGVFGTNAGGGWTYIVTISGTLGWVPLDSLRIMGSMEGAPVLPDNPLAPKVAKAAPSPSAKSGSSRPLTVADLKEVTTASVNSAQLNMRQGPGPAYKVLAVLKRDETVSLLALNKPKDWVLVKTSGGQIGWVYLEYLRVEGSLAELPSVVSAAPDADILAGEIAPILGATTPPGGTKAQPTSAPTRVSPPGTSRSDRALSAPKPSIQTMSLVTQLRPLGVGRPARGEVTLYRGPGSTYEPIVTLYVDDRVDILGLAAGSQMPPGGGDWVLVKPRDKSPGWTMLQDLTVEGSLDEVPQVTTAWVVSNELPVRIGPGLTYERNGVLAIHTMVSVLGINKDRGWALVTPVTGGGPGWIPLNFLSLGGAWTDMPELPDTALAQAAPTREIAPRLARVGGQLQGELVLQLSSGGDIMVINADGSGLHRLTSGIDPVLSPDGSMVAFTRWTGEDGSVWVINVDGTGERPVLGSTKQAKHAAWSPDGSRIVVNFQHGGQLTYEESCKDLLNLKGRQPNIPWNVNPDSIRVTIRDGRPYLCWDRPPDPWWGLRVVTLSDGTYQDVPSDRYAYGPEWDPANPWRIVSSGINGLVQLDANRLEQWALTDQREDHTPVFSPDGRYVAVSYDQHGGYDIHRLNSDGSGRVRLTETPLWVTAAPDGGKQWNNVSPAWSPDGSQIAFLTDRSGRWEIWVMNWDGSNPHPMFPKEVNDQLPIRYDFVDERVLSWR
jgi:uncharacterized protein YgiM (DUF1202 family)